MSIQPEKPVEMFGLTVTCTRLKYEAAEDILPEVGGIFVAAIEQALNGVGALDGGLENLDIKELRDLKKIDVAKWIPILAPILSKMFKQLGRGELKRLAPLILAGTEVIMEVEPGIKERHLMSSAKDRAKVFEAYPEAYIPMLLYAGKVTFARYFPVAGLGAGLTATV